MIIITFDEAESKENILLAISESSHCIFGRTKIECTPSDCYSCLSEKLIFVKKDDSLFMNICMTAPVISFSREVQKIFEGKKFIQTEVDLEARTIIFKVSLGQPGYKITRGPYIARITAKNLIEKTALKSGQRYYGKITEDTFTISY